MKQIMKQILDPMEVVQRFLDGKEVYAVDLKDRSVYKVHLVTLKDLKNNGQLYFELKQESEEEAGSPEKPEE